ncbi:MAG: hypothetical protein AB7E13_07505 [Arcobacteraceae bacterium]
MSSENIENTFKEKIYECNKHIEKINISKKHLLPFIPLNTQTYLKMDEVSLSFIDSLIFRFSKLQDTMGEKIFPSILILSKEDVKKKTFLDILNRLEELEIVNKNEWLSLREARNEIAHEYSFNTNEVVDSINIIYEKSENLINIYQKVYNFCNTRFNIV